MISHRISFILLVMKLFFTVFCVCLLNTLAVFAQKPNSPERMDMAQLYASNALSIADFSLPDTGKAYTKYEFIGRNYFLQLDYERALIYYRRGLPALDQNDLYTPRKKAAANIAVGECLSNLNQLDEAKGYFEKGLDYLKNRETEDTYAWVLEQKSKNEIGALLLKKRALDEAFKILSRGIIEATNDSTFFKNHERKAVFYDQLSNYQLNIAKYYEHRKDYLIAIEFYHKSLKNSEKVQMHSNIRVSKAYYGLAVCTTGLDEKLKLIQKAIVALSSEYKDDYWQSNPTDFQQFHRFHRQMLLTCLNFKIFILYQKWRRNKDQKGFLNLALKTCHEATNLIAVIRKDLGDSQGQKEQVLPYFLMTFEQGIEMAQSLFRMTGDAYYFDEAYYFTEQNKALLLAEARNAAKVWSFSGLPEAMIEKEKQLKNAIVKAEIDLENAIGDKDIDLANEIRENQLFLARWRYDSFRNALKKDHTDLFQQQFETEIPNVFDVQQYLDNETIIVEYSMNDVLDQRIYKSDNRTMYIYTIGKYDLSITVTAWTEELDKKIAEFYHLLQKATIVRSKNRTKFIELGRELYEVLIAPIKPYLGGAKRLIFIGEDKLNYLPFEVLLTEDAETKIFQELPYLLKDYEVSYHYSASLLHDSFKNKKDENGGMLTFAPVFEKEQLTQSLFIENRSVADTALSFARSGRFLPLQWTSNEAETIDSMFTQNRDAINTILLKEDANETLLKQLVEKPYQYIHIATHSFANMKRPDFSGIACFQEEEGAVEDGILYLNEINNLKLQADLVTLSSCESGVGELLVGEGMLGLNRAFIYAGAPNVLFTLWKVNDKTTAQLMIDFYENILNGQPYSTALRNAKLTLLSKPESSLPLYWTPFQLIGR